MLDTENILIVIIIAHCIIILLRYYMPITWLQWGILLVQRIIKDCVTKCLVRQTLFEFKLVEYTCACEFQEHVEIGLRPLQYSM